MGNISSRYCPPGEETSQHQITTGIATSQQEKRNENEEPSKLKKERKCIIKNLYSVEHHPFMFLFSFFPLLPLVKFGTRVVLSTTKVFIGWPTRQKTPESPNVKKKKKKKRVLRTSTRTSINSRKRIRVVMSRPLTTTTRPHPSGVENNDLHTREKERERRLRDSVIMASLWRTWYFSFPSSTLDFVCLLSRFQMAAKQHLAFPSNLVNFFWVLTWPKDLYYIQHAIYFWTFISHANFPPEWEKKRKK